MNIFYIDSDPKKAAVCMVDRHVVKMILESAQMLSTAHRVLDGIKKDKIWHLQDERESALYKATHINHPSNIWVRESIQNYLWLVEHFFALNDEYTFRYNKRHKSFSLGYLLQSPPKNLTAYNLTPIPLAMDDKYKVDNDPVKSYRNYYRDGKSHLHKYTRRETPDWLND